jgi:serine phosphatase RsbU (regulator of sigma subunit)
VPGFDLAGWNRPARQVGGDYYDLLPLENGKVAVVLGDVSGKGMPAALLVSTLHSALRLLLDRIGVGAELMERLNRHLVESSLANKFVTSLVAELDPATGEMTYLNAGHNPALLLRRGGEVEQLGPGGVPLGLLPNARFAAKEVEVRPGDLLCIYSDGITEAESVADEEFGMERLTACLAENRNRPLSEVVEKIDRAVTKFAEGLPQRDDQTVVLLRRHCG